MQQVFVKQTCMDRCIPLGMPSWLRILLALVLQLIWLLDYVHANTHSLVSSYNEINKRIELSPRKPLSDKTMKFDCSNIYMEI